MKKNKPLKTIKAIGTRYSLILLDAARLKNQMDLDFRNTNVKESLISKPRKKVKSKKLKPGNKHFKPELLLFLKQPMKLENSLKIGRELLNPTLMKLSLQRYSTLKRIKNPVSQNMLNSSLKEPYLKKPQSSLRRLTSIWSKEFSECSQALNQSMKSVPIELLMKSINLRFNLN